MQIIETVNINIECRWGIVPWDFCVSFKMVASQQLEDESTTKTLVSFCFHDFKLPLAQNYSVKLSPKKSEQ